MAYQRVLRLAIFLVVRAIHEGAPGTGQSVGPYVFGQLHLPFFNEATGAHPSATLPRRSSPPSHRVFHTQLYIDYIHF